MMKKRSFIVQMKKRKKNSFQSHHHYPGRNIFFAHFWLVETFAVWIFFFLYFSRFTFLLIFIYFFLCAKAVCLSDKHGNNFSVSVLILSLNSLFEKINSDLLQYPVSADDRSEQQIHTLRCHFVCRYRIFLFY